MCWRKQNCLWYDNFDYYILTLLSGDRFKIGAWYHDDDDDNDELPEDGPWGQNCREAFLQALCTRAPSIPGTRFLFLLKKEKKKSSLYPSTKYTKINTMKKPWTSSSLWDLIVGVRGLDITGKFGASIFHGRHIPDWNCMRIFDQLFGPMVLVLGYSFVGLIDAISRF